MRTERRVVVEDETMALWVDGTASGGKRVLLRPIDVSLRGVGVARDDLLSAFGSQQDVRRFQAHRIDPHEDVLEVDAAIWHDPSPRATSGLRLATTEDLVAEPTPASITPSRSGPCRRWMESVLAQLNPTASGDVRRVSVPTLLEAFHDYWWRPDAKARAEARAEVRALLEHFCLTLHTHAEARSLGWLSCVWGRRYLASGRSMSANRRQLLGLICFQPLSNGVVAGHQIAVGLPPLDGDAPERLRWARAQVRRALYLDAFERLDYLSWMQVMTGLYIVKGHQDGGGWMARAHGDFARTLGPDEAVDFPIFKLRCDSARVAGLPDPGLRVDLTDWDDDARADVRAAAARIRTPLYCQAMELDAPLDRLPTPFRVSVREADGWSAQAEDARTGPRRARRRLRVLADGEIVAQGFVDAVGWPVNISYLLDAMRLYPMGRGRSEAAVWADARRAALRRAAAWFAEAEIPFFCFIDEPARPIERPEPSVATEQLPGPTRLDGLQPGFPGADPYHRAAGRQWTLRGGGKANGRSGRGTRGRFSAFAAWAEDTAQAELSGSAGRGEEG
ncbi:MAG: hypothetical protein H6704_28330 [Myxococcales bacterium]|nr:hypothetical protein [Myxococcales bacterium]